MPRKKFRMAPDAARRRIICGNYVFNEGAPYCKALTHPWCLAPGESQATCKFSAPPEPTPKKEPKPEKKPAPEDADDGEAN